MRSSGIYKIQSKIHPERCYIGSAVWLKDGWWHHLKDFRKNKHGNSKLQNHFNKYGESDLVFSVLAICRKEELIPVNGVIWIEQVFIWAYKTINSDIPWFNICKIAGSNLGVKRSKKTCKKIREGHMGQIPWNKGKTGVYSEEAKQKMREKRIGHVSWNKGVSNEKAKKILQYDRNMNFIKEWNSARDAARVLSIGYRHIYDVAGGQRKTAYSFVWKYKNIA